MTNLSDISIQLSQSAIVHHSLKTLEELEVDIEASISVIVELDPVKPIKPETSQSPAVRVKVATWKKFVDVIDTALALKTTF